MCTGLRGQFYRNANYMQYDQLQTIKAKKQSMLEFKSGYLGINFFMAACRRDIK